MMAIRFNVRPFWSDWQSSIEADVSSRFYEAFHLDDKEATAGYLAELVLKGAKRATACLLCVYDYVKGRVASKPVQLDVDLSQHRVLNSDDILLWSQCKIWRCCWLPITIVISAWLGDAFNCFLA